MGVGIGDVVERVVEKEVVGVIVLGDESCAFVEVGWFTGRYVLSWVVRGGGLFRGVSWFGIF